MAAVARFAAEGGPVVGICNGFQVLTEAGLLPGALYRNAGLRFLCKTVECEVSSTDSILTMRTQLGQVLRLPINHYEGNYTCDATTLRELEDEGRVVLRYRGDNPNGSVHAIAGITNREGNVVGLMPHPERASDPMLGSADGRLLLESLLDASAAGRRYRSRTTLIRMRMRYPQPDLLCPRTGDSSEFRPSGAPPQTRPPRARWRSRSPCDSRSRPRRG